MEKVYCDECKYLQNREIKVGDEVTGTRYYCSKKIGGLPLGQPSN